MTPSCLGRSLGAELAEFVSSVSLQDIPEDVRLRAKLQILDALGVGIAAVAYPFAGPAIASVRELGGTGPCSVIGHSDRLAARDAALVNGILIHGLDFDDTHLGSIVHPTTACLPTALAMAETTGACGEALLVAFIAGMETAIRIGLVADGAFHHAGYHATGIASHFSAAIVAGKLIGLDAKSLTMAQGIAGSTAAGIQVFLEEGAWTKRLHPGWGATSGITAAYLARNGFVGPMRPYEGKFGLFETHFQSHAAETHPERLIDSLGQRWHLSETAIKPYPVCHFIHGCADAAIALSEEIDAAQILEVEALLPAPTMSIVAEPAEAKIAPKTDYEAKFSAQFVVATCLVRGHFGLTELTPAALSDPALVELSQRVRCSVDPDSEFPTHFSGGVRVTLRDGRTLVRHVPVNSGAGDRALDAQGVGRKFLACAETTIGSEVAERVRDAVLTLEQHEGSALGDLLSAPEQ